MLVYLAFLRINFLINLKYFINNFISSVTFLFFVKKKTHLSLRVFFSSYTLFWTNSSVYDSLILRFFDNFLFLILNSVAIFGVLSPIESFTFFFKTFFCNISKNKKINMLFYFLYGYFFFIIFFLVVIFFVIITIV